MWISTKDRLPEKGENCWYFYDKVGTWRGHFEGCYNGNKDMHIFVAAEGYFLTGDVTHWHPDQEEKPDEPV